MLGGYIYASRTYYYVYPCIPLTPKNTFMPIEEQVQQMEGKILLLDNKKFVACISFIGLYYIAFIVFLTRMLLESGGFH